MIIRRRPATALSRKSKNIYRGEREREMEGLTEEEKRALRGSKFAPLPSAPPSQSQPRLAHPGGPMKTNKAAALAKFLERKMHGPNGLATVDPKLIELAVKNAKDTLKAGGETSISGRIIRHVDSFGDSEESAEEEVEISVSKKNNKKKKKEEKTKKKEKKKSNKRKQKLEDSTYGKTKKSKKKMKL